MFSRGLVEKSLDLHGQAAYHHSEDHNDLLHDLLEQLDVLIDERADAVQARDDVLEVSDAAVGHARQQIRHPLLWAADLADGEQLAGEFLAGDVALAVAQEEIEVELILGPELRAV